MADHPPRKAPLAEYKRKRNFSKTPEPAGITATPNPAGDHRLAFVIQKHAARRLHYDFRLELDGVLLSWAIPKCPSYDPEDRRLAVHVEDHPIEYGGFEGVIPAGEYGGGTVMLWDRGWWEPEGDPRKDFSRGHLSFSLYGEKLHGSWTLVRLDGRDDRRAKDEWLLIKRRDQFATPGQGSGALIADDRSVATGRDMDAISDDRDRMWSSRKGEIDLPRAQKSIDLAKIAGAKRAKAIPDLAPALATATEKAPSGDGWVHEIKFDGYRMLASVSSGKATFKTRNGLNWTGRFPELAQALARLAVKDALVDGEVVHVLGNGTTSFSALQNDLSEGKTGELVYMAFDLLYLDGWDLTGASLQARKAALEALLAGLAEPRLRYSEDQQGRGPEFFAAVCGMGLEGIVSKRRDAPYRSGRTQDWLKAKCDLREEFIILGFTDPARARPGFGALLMGYRTPKGELAYAGKVGTGYSMKFLGDFRKKLGTLEIGTATAKLPRDVSLRGIHWVKPEVVADIAFAGWTGDRIIRHARFVGLREDKGPDEVVLDPEQGVGKSDPDALDPPQVANDGSAVVAGVRITNAERVLYPGPGISKLAVAEYYAQVADLILPHLAGRPLSLLRCPEGIEGECFFQKHPRTGFPSEVALVPIAEKSGTRPYAVVDDLKGLLGLLQMGVLEIHPWGSTVEHLEQPDRLIFDLDPDEGLGWDRVVAAALELRDLLGELGLRSFPKATGGKGIHLVVPVVPDLAWDEAKAFTAAVAAKLVERGPDRYTDLLPKNRRKGRIFIDYLRNGRGATAIAPYSTRAKPAATVAVPLSWDDVENGIRGDQFTVESLPARLRSLKTDPWADLRTIRQRIGAKARRGVTSETDFRRKSK